MDSADYCKVTERGVAHLFRRFDYGRPCACGRKMLSFSPNDEEAGLVDLPREALSPLARVLIARSRRLATTSKMDQLLARGQTEIDRARRARSSVRTDRVWGARVRGEAAATRGMGNPTVTRGIGLVALARGARSRSAMARQRREAATIRRTPDPDCSRPA